MEQRRNTGNDRADCISARPDAGPYTQRDAIGASEGRPAHTPRCRLCALRRQTPFALMPRISGWRLSIIRLTANSSARRANSSSSWQPEGYAPAYIAKRPLSAADAAAAAGRATPAPVAPSPEVEAHIQPVRGRMVRWMSNNSSRRSVVLKRYLIHHDGVEAWDLLQRYDGTCSVERSGGRRKLNISVDVFRKTEDGALMAESLDQAIARASADMRSNRPAS